MQKQDFTKDDLRTGMLVQYRGGDIGLVINDYIILHNGYHNLEDVTRCLKSIYFEENDIVKTSFVLEEEELMPSNWTKNTLNENLLWERKEPRETIKIGKYEYDKEEVEYRLKDLTPLTE